MYSSQTLVSDGTVTRVDLSIEYLVKEDIKVFVDDALLPTNGYAWTWASDTAINFNQPVRLGSVINVRRATAYDKIKHIFEVGGAIFKDRNVDENFRQVLYWCQDFIEGKSITDVWNDLNMHGYRILNLGAAKDPYDAVPLGQYQADAMGAWTAQRLATKAKETAYLEAQKAVQSALEAAQYLDTLQGAILDAETAKTLATQASLDATYAKSIVDAWQRGEFLSVDTAADLVPASAGAISYVKSITATAGIGGIFKYDPSRAAINDGGYILNGWVRQTDHLEFAYWPAITTNLQLATVLRTAMNNNLPINDFSGKTYSATGTMDISVPYGKTLRIDTNCSFDVEAMTIRGTQHVDRVLTAPASEGQYTITVDSTHLIKVGTIMILRNTTPNSFANFSDSANRAYYKDGEMAEVESVNGKVITFKMPLITSYPDPRVIEVSVLDGGKLVLNGITVRNKSHLNPLVLMNLTIAHLGYAELNDVRAENHHVSGTSAIRFTQCWNLINNNPDILNYGTLVDGGCYGISVSNSTFVYNNGGRAHGLSPAIGCGGDDTKGAVPCRGIISTGMRLTNTDKARHTADFHGNVRDSKYIDCTIDGAVTCGGLNNGYINCKVKSYNALLPVDLGEHVGGVIDLSGTTIEITPTSTANRFVGFSAGSMGKGQKYNSILRMVRCTLVWRSPATTALSLVMPQCSKPDVTMDLELISPNLVGLENVLFNRAIMYAVLAGAKKPNRIIMRDFDCKYTTMLYDGIATYTKIEYPETWGSTPTGGRWFKAKDGTMTITHQVTNNTVVDTPNGVLGFVSGAYLWTFPQTFAAAPAVFIGTQPRSSGAVYYNNTTTGVNYQYTAAAAQTTALDRQLSLQAVGRWV